METDPGLLLTLLAVRLLGSRMVPAGAPVLKAFKEPLKLAKQHGWLEESKTKVPTVTKAGKAGTKSAAVLNLTEAGERFLLEHASPEALAATGAGQLTALRQGLEAEKETLRREVLNAVSPPAKDKGAGGMAKQIKDMEKAVTALANRLNQLETKLQGGASDAVLTRIDAAFASLEAKVTQALSGIAAAGASGTGKPTPTAQPRPVPEPPRPASIPVATALHEAYEVLSGFREFEDGLVELPRLYHQARKQCPDLSPARFRQEVESLWDSRQVQLHVRNEVRSAAEPELAIQRHDKLYYYIFWPGS